MPLYSRYEFIVKPLIVVLVLFSMLGCKSPYQKGHDEGYASGYSDGRYDGYREGKRQGYESGRADGYSEGRSDGYEDGETAGYKSGYTSGTLHYLKEHGLPSLGLTVITLIVLALIYFSYRYIRGPTKRAIDRSTDAVEEKRQKNITKKELERKRLSVEEQAKERARQLSSRMFEKTLEAITDEKCKFEVEKLRRDAERKIFETHLDSIDRMAKEYQDSIESLNASKNLSPVERTQLYKEIREIASGG